MYHFSDIYFQNLLTIDLSSNEIEEVGARYVANMLANNSVILMYCIYVNNLFENFHHLDDNLYQFKR